MTLPATTAADYGDKINWDFYELPTDMAARSAAGQNAARLCLGHSPQQLHDSLPGYFDTGEMTREQITACSQRCRAIMLALTAEPAGKEPREAGNLDWEAWEKIPGNCSALPDNLQGPARFEAAEKLGALLKLLPGVLSGAELKAGQKRCRAILSALEDKPAYSDLGLFTPTFTDES